MCLWPCASDKTYDSSHSTHMLLCMFVYTQVLSCMCFYLHKTGHYSFSYKNLMECPLALPSTPNTPSTLSTLSTLSTPSTPGTHSTQSTPNTHSTPSTSSTQVSAQLFHLQQNPYTLTNFQARSVLILGTRWPRLVSNVKDVITQLPSNNRSAAN